MMENRYDQELLDRLKNKCSDWGHVWTGDAVVPLRRTGEGCPHRSPLTGRPPPF